MPLPGKPLLPDAEPIRWKPLLWALLFGNLVIGSGVMGVAATLKEISEGFSQTLPATGMLIAAASLTICLAAPLLASLTACISRRALLSFCLLWYALLHVLETLATDFAYLLVLRVLSVLAAAVFTPQAAAYVGRLAPQGVRGRYIAFIFLGWSLASVAGMPVMAWVSGQWGWRSVFWGIAILALLSAAGVYAAVSSFVPEQSVRQRAWKHVFRHRALLLCIASTVLYSGGQFMLLAYFTPFFRIHLAMAPLDLSMLFAWFGLLGLLGNTALSVTVDQWGASRAVLLALGAIGLSLLCWPLGTRDAMGMWIVIIPWALAIFALNSAQQARLVQWAPAYASTSIALNASAMYGGQAVGAFLGGELIALDAMDSMNWWALAAILLAMGISALADWQMRRMTVHQSVPALQA